MTTLDPDAVCADDELIENLRDGAQSPTGGRLAEMLAAYRAEIRHRSRRLRLAIAVVMAVVVALVVLADLPLLVDWALCGVQAVLAVAYVAALQLVLLRWGPR